MREREREKGSERDERVEREGERRETTERPERDIHPPRLLDSD